MCFNVYVEHLMRVQRPFSNFIRFFSFLQDTMMKWMAEITIEKMQRIVDE